MNNPINLTEFKKKKRGKMIVAILAIVATLALIVWKFFIEDSYLANIKIPGSSNIAYHKINPLTPNDIVTKLDNEKGRPLFLYLYTTWCGVCKKNFPIINELSREFQNANITIIAIAIDRNLNDVDFAQYLEVYGDIYFKPYYLVYSEGMSDLIKQKGIKYNGVIPFTVLIDKNGNVVESFNGIKKSSSMRSKIIRLIYQDGNQII